MLFPSRNELFLVQTWTPGWAPGPVWTQRSCSQAEMSCTDLGPWLGSWPCLDSKDAVLKQK